MMINLHDEAVDDGKGRPGVQSVIRIQSAYGVIPL